MKVGIISGMGAAAGVHFLDLLVKECQRRGAKTDMDFPEIILHSISSNGLDEHGIANARAIKTDLLNSVSFLNLCDVDKIVVACNTVHIFHDVMQMWSRANIVNMIEVTSQECCGLECVGVLSSRSTRESRLYWTALKKRGISVIECEDHEQSEIDRIIGSIISGDQVYLAEASLYGIIGGMYQKGAEKIILGCTELPLIVGNDPRLIDAGECAIKEVLN